ncbi:MAG: glutathione S-transferase family protein [Caulobacteraceae bacterium]
MYTLFARPGWGSVLVEAQLAWCGLPYTIEEVDDLFESAKARERLSAINPAAQLPTLLLPDGGVMTESAAITLHLADVTGSDALVPAAAEAERPRFLRWLVFLVANIYPTFTYADDPRRFVTGKAAQGAFRKSVDRYQQELWGMVEQATAAPWFLGERFSALDIFIAAMTRWRPRRAWFAEHRPALHAIAERADALPRLSGVWERNFPAGED